MKFLRLPLFFASCLLSINLTYAQVPTIAVAANMKEAFNEISVAFRATRQSEMKVVYGSSGNFTAQILNGAPFNLLIAADEHFPLVLYKNGKAIDEGKIYAIGKLALIAKPSLISTSNASKVELMNMIAKANKIAIAKPELAPYGKAAIEYLKAEGLWDLAKDKLIYGDNIGVATMYVATGAADLGFTALSLASSPQVSQTTRFQVLDTKLYQPIQQRMVLMKGAPAEALDLYQFIQSQQAKSILHKHGYSTP